MKSLLSIVAGLVTVALALPAPPQYAVHEKRLATIAMWTITDIELDRRTILPISIGLTQQNLDAGHQYLMDVSDPNSKNYGKHWTTDKVAKVFAPTLETITAVRSWLTQNGIANDRIQLSKGSNWIRVNMTVDEAESLLHTRYRVYEHAQTKKTHIACEDYSVPTDVKESIDYITPTINFDAILTAPKKRRNLPRAISHSNVKRTRPDPHVHKNPSPVVLPKVTPNVAASPFTLGNCNTYITPACLRALYNIPSASLNSSKSSFGIVEITPQSYHQSDLDLFYTTAATNVPAGTAPLANLIDGAIIQQTTSGFSYNAESSLDFEYAIALVYPQTVTLYQVGDMVASGSFGTFLDAIDATYCTSGGGDDPNVDPSYPNSGYASKDCGTFAATSVISVSYTYNEADISPAYEQRQCSEYMKLGLLGVTILFASGDYGVEGNNQACCTNVNCTPGGYNPVGGGGSFAPSFPATCPYITAVGATQIASGASVSAAEVASQSVIYSGGGFSNVFPMPSYQTSSLSTYFKKHKPSYTSGQYNNGSMRGYPDISANGANYVIAVDGGLALVYGTSASAPVVGSIITLINGQRAKAGKTAVGFINPVLYANPSAMNDIKTGSNPGCGAAGFTAVSGWDPVTGLGTPDYKKLLKVFLALP